VCVMSNTLGRRVWPVLGLALLAGVVVWVLGYLFRAQDRGLVGTVIQTVAAILVPAIGAASWLLRQRQHDEPSPRNLDRAADELAAVVQVQWDRAAVERRLRYPARIPVGWCWSDRPVSGPKFDAVGGAPATVRVPALPGMAQVGLAAVEGGGLSDLLGIYGGLDSGRIVVSGGPGAGKSSAAILLLLDTLAHRAGLTEPADRVRTPVPVMLTFRGWDAARQPLMAWVASRLTAEYPFLRSAEYGRGMARALVDNGRVALLLDGLDDLPDSLRPVALRALDEQATFRLVLLARSQELADAVVGGHLTGAAPLELQPVTGEQAAAYLSRCRVDPAPPGWQRLIEHLRARPDDVLTQALETPLMLSLVRDTYPPGDQLDDLLSPNRFGTREAVEDHLLDRVLPAAYTPRPAQPSPPYTLAQARCWLGYVAAQMVKDHTRDLAWWRIPRWQRTAFRIIATVLMVSLTLGLSLGLLSGPPGVAGGLTDQLTFATEFGIVVGLVFGRGGGEPRQWGRIRWRALMSKGGLTVGLALALTVGIAVSLTLGLVFGLAYGLMLGTTSGLGVGLVGALAFAAAHSSVHPLSPIDPMTCWRRDRRYGLTVGLMLGLVFGLTVGLTDWIVFGLAFRLGVASGLMGGLAYGLAYGVISSKTWPAALSFVQLRLAGHGPARMMRFLEDARTRQVLRTAGPIFQFRHARLQDRLAVPVSQQPSVPNPRPGTQ
jgi:hypothetical protein